MEDANRVEPRRRDPRVKEPGETTGTCLTIVRGGRETFVNGFSFFMARGKPCLASGNAVYRSMQTVLLTPTFELQAKAAGLSEDDIAAIASSLAADPLAGDLIAGTGGARKVRFARTGFGKSGGYRTVHYFGGDDVPIFLLALIDKRKRANLSKAERNELAEILPMIAAAYREGRRK
jgi:hypothetical protein